MDNRNLGIYLSRERAIAALTFVEDGMLKVAECFTVTKEAKADQDCPSIAAQIAAELSSRQVSFDSVSIAVDCTMYTQHDIRSNFTDYKQIANTIRFDIEEVIGDDINRMAIAFYVVKSEEDSSIVTAFTAVKSELAEILADFQKHKIDPEVIEPDVVAFSRAVSYEMTDNSSRSPLFAAFGQKICYNSVMNSSHSTPVLRSFLYPESIDKTEVLSKQLKLTLARNTITVPVDTLCVINSDVDTSRLSGKYQMNCPQLEDMFKQNSVLFGDGSAGDVETAIAAASSMAFSSKRNVDLRQSFAPYQGKKRVIEISLRLIALAASILLLALAFNHTVSMMQVRNSISKVNERTNQEYSSAMRGKEMTSKAAVLTLQSEVKKLQRIKSGEDGGDDNSIASRLRYILEAINSTPTSINLKINSITVSEGLMRIDGSTNSRANTQQLLNAIDKHSKLRRAQESLQQTGAVDSFSVNIELVK